MDHFFVVSTTLKLEVSTLVFKHRFGGGEFQGRKVGGEHSAFSGATAFPGFGHGANLNCQPASLITSDAQHPSDGSLGHPPQVGHAHGGSDQGASAGGVKGVVDVGEVRGVEHLAGHFNTHQAGGEHLVSRA